MGAVLPMTHILLALLVLGSLILLGCTNTSDDFDVARLTLSRKLSNIDPRVQALEQENGAVYLKLALLDFDTGSLIIREDKTGAFETWLTPEGSSLTTQDGFLVATRGLGQGLMAADVEQPRHMIRTGMTGASVRFHSYLTGNDEIETRTYFCDIESRGQEAIMIDNAPFATQVYAESCGSMDQSFENLYWISVNSNEILQTSQWVGDFLGSIATQVIPK